ncbi:MAG: NAD(P)H-binding protein [Bradymonadaceae bacterium]|nr:NAD(P)H-binding protein [Lujinxingiaceae bacterium]
MKAFVAGATGFTGREVVRLWAEEGGEALAHVRPDSSRLEEWTTTFSAMGAAVDTTAWEPQALAKSFERLKPDVIFCLIGTTKKRMKEFDKDQASYEAVDYGLTAMLLEAACLAELKARFVYLSSSGVGPNSALGYFQARWKAEQAVVASGLEYVIARPGIITGERDESRPMERIAGEVGDKLLGMAAMLGAKGLEERYRSTSSVELAGRLVALSRDASAAGRVFESQELNRMG